MGVDVVGGVELVEGGRSAEAVRALRDAAPAALGEVMSEVAGRLFGAAAARVLLVDYRISVLLPVPAESSPAANASPAVKTFQSVEPAGLVESSQLVAATVRPLPVDGSAAGRVFCGQQSMLTATDGGWRMLVPVTARGHRWGVLEVDFAQRPDQALCAELVELAEALAHELVVASLATDTYRRARRMGRLTLAAEMQWDLLPGREMGTDRYALAGQLEPAYAVCGDTFDWSADPEGLSVAVINGRSEGLPAAMLTAFAVSALRNGRRCGVDLAEQAALASDMVYLQHGGHRQVEALLACYRPGCRSGEGQLRVVNAGAPLILRLRGGQVEPIEVSAQPPLGIEADATYRVDSVPVAAGDRLVLLSDGVHEALDAATVAYSATALGRLLRRTRLQPPGEVVRSVIRDVLAHHGGTLDDDGVAVCLDIR
jgi:serine phosphatase RsbU (regulator of sigma subunit)